MSTSHHTGDPGNPGHHPRLSGHPASIRYVRRHEIDTARWDACIGQSATPLIYGFHFYLDHMTTHPWDALILGDYEAVMPLTWRRKYGIRYLYQPPFTQQTGIFSAQPLSPGLIEAFAQTARHYFRFAEIFLNHGNALPAFEPRTNYILSLDAPYPQLAANYKKDLVRNLRLAARSPMVYSSEVDLPSALESYRQEYGARTPHVHAGDYRAFAALCRYCHTRGRLVLRAATTPGGESMSTALLLRDQARLYLLQSTTSAAGRRQEANHYLLDQLVREWAGSGLTLDFEGSELPGVAHFYANFGAIRQPYYFYRYNRLPWPIKLLKS